MTNQDPLWLSLSGRELFGTFSTDCPFERVSKTGDATEVSPNAEFWLSAGWGETGMSFSIVKTYVRRTLYISDIQKKREPSVVRFTHEALRLPEKLNEQLQSPR